MKLISRNDFTPLNLNCGVDNSFSATVFSSNGTHLAAGTVDGKIIFWNVATGAQFAEVKSKEEPSMVCR